MELEDRSRDVVHARVRYDVGEMREESGRHRDRRAHPSPVIAPCPRQDLRETNGHARVGDTHRAEALPAQLTIAAPKPRSTAALYKAAATAARAYDRDWFMVVRSLQEPSMRGNIDLESGGTDDSLPSRSSSATRLVGPTVAESGGRLRLGAG